MLFTALFLISAAVIPLPKAAESQGALRNTRNTFTPEKQSIITVSEHPDLTTASLPEVAGLFVVKTKPQFPVPAVMQTEAPPEVPESLPEAKLSSLPALPAVRYLGEAVIGGQTIVFCMTGSPERLLRLPDTEEEFILTENSPKTLTIEYNGRSIHVPK